MFRKTKDEQLDMFKSLSTHLSNRKRKSFEDQHSWHQVFWKYFVSRIDEQPYSVLYCKDNGRPNASVRILIGMMLLKESNGWSDEQLFEECQFNIKACAALGVDRLDQDLPSPSSYYQFRKLLAQHYESTGEDLLDQTFKQCTSSQIATMEIKGSKVRMDSKLIQSNIARNTRLQLIVEAIRVHLQTTEIAILQTILSSEQYKIIAYLKDHTTSNLTYTLTSQEKEEMLINIGHIIQAMIANGRLRDQSVLYQIYHQHYEEVSSPSDQHPEKQCATPDDNKPYDEDQGDGDHKGLRVRSPNAVKSDSIQSVHDTEAAYRKKGKDQNIQVVKGYHSNITEICTQANQPNLITNVQTTAANVSESQFLQPSISETQKLLSPEDSVEEVITDGGYDSIANRAALQQQDQLSWKLAKLKGNKRVYHISLDEHNEPQVIHVITGKPCDVKYAKRADKYVIKRPDKNTKRYMTREEINTYIAAQKSIGQISQEDQNLRANVESTIHQVFHRLLKGNKTKYRGRLKSHWYVLFRSIYTNLTRIGEFNALKAFNLINFWIRHSVNALKHKMIYFQVFLNTNSKSIYCA